MILLKSIAGGVLYIGALVLATPTLFFQEATPGKPDDIAELLPADTILFAEITKAPLLFRDWKEYVGSFATKEGKGKLCADIEKAVKDAVDAIPEKLMKDFEKGLPSIQRIAFAVWPCDDTVVWAVMASASDAEFFRKIVDEDLKVFAFEEHKHQGSNVLSIRKLGEMKLDEPLHIAAVGNRLVVSMNPNAVEALLDRAAGKVRGEDLRKHGLYGELTLAQGEDALFRGFALMPWDTMTRLERRGISGRASAHEMDMSDAMMDFSKIRGTTVEATLRPGKIEARTRVHVDAPCRLFDVWSQPAGPKDLVKLLPADTQFFAHVNIRSGKELWAQVEPLIDRAAKIGKKAHPDRGDLREEMDREMQREVGFTLGEIAPVIGNEGVLAYIGSDALETEENLEGGALLILIKVANEEKARDFVEKMVQHKGESYETKVENGVTFHFAKPEGRMPSFAVARGAFMLAGKHDTLRALARDSAGGIERALPAGAAQASKLVMARNSALWQLVKLASDGRVADYSKELHLEPWSAVLMSEGKTSWNMASSDAGVGGVAQIALLGAPIALFLRSPEPPMPWGEKPNVPAQDEPPTLPKEKLEAEVKVHLEDLRSDDMATREAGLGGLRALGRQAIPLLVEAVKRETDRDARETLMKLLVDWRVYDAFPELAGRKVEAFIKEWQEVMGRGRRGDPHGGDEFVSWYRDGDAATNFPWAVEPNYVNLALLSQLEHRDVLEIEAAAKMLIEAIGSDRLPIETRQMLAMFAAFGDCSKAGSGTFEAYEKVSDADTKLFMQIALGCCPDPRATEALLRGIKDSNRWIGRASFLGIERSKDTGVIPKLIELLKDPDHETAWNASFTLRQLTGGRVHVNVFMPGTEFDQACAAAREWWEANKGTYRIK